MADAKKCDRCGEFYEPHYLYDHLSVSKIKNNRNGFPHTVYYDLCSDCTKKLNLFLTDSNN